MASKKFSFITSALCLFGLATMAQTTTGYDVMDSSLISKKNLPQHNEFKNNAYPFPAKPKNQLEIGVKVGSFTVSGDVPATVPTAGFGVHVRKALGYVFSVRAEYTYGIAKGMNWKSRTAGFSNAFVGRYPAGSTVYDNYKTKMQDISIEGVASLNNIKFHKDKTKVEVYLLGGIGAGFFSTKVNALNGTAAYNFSSIAGNADASKKDAKKALKNLLDDTYETGGEDNGRQQKKLFGLPFTPTMSVGAGLAFRLSKRINLALEDRFAFTTSDLLDGQRYQNISPSGTRILGPDKDGYNYLSVGLNINLGKKSIEPLWWINPLDYAYNEINMPKHMKLPKPVLDDADGDGITDQFDQEPNTPANAPVDSHGVSRDTDGDGVPDYKDKELVTPTQCQPVNADGVGNCPPPACCATLDSLIKAGGIKPPGCGIGELPSISFKARAVALSNDAKAVLASVAEKMRSNPACRVAVVGYGESNKAAQQLSWDRVNTVINYMVEKEGISQDRFVFKYGQGDGAADTVDLREATTEDVPNSVPAPSPNLRKKK